MSLSELGAMMDEMASGGRTESGVLVSRQTALNFSAVYNAVNIISGTIASLPLLLYRRTGEYGKERLTNHPLYYCLHNMANPEMTSFVWREVSQQHMLLHGNAYSQIIRDGSLRTKELWPISPEAIEVKRDENRKIFYKLNKSDGSYKIFQANEILHIPGMGFDGRMGYSIMTLARESFGLGLAQEIFSAQFYGKGTNYGNVLEHPGKLGDVAYDNLKKDFEKDEGKKAHGVLILEEGMKWKSTVMPLQDAQFLESRIFQIAEIARWFNLQLHKLSELSHATFSNIEQMQIQFVQDTIRPWLVRWEQHIWWKLLNDEEKKLIFAEFLIDGLLRGDMESRQKGLDIMRRNGVINADQWAGIENMNPIGGKAGQTYWMPLNMADANAEEAEKVDKSKDKFEPEEKSVGNFELRGMRSINLRRRYAKAFKPIFRAVGESILKIEIPAVKRLAAEAFTQRDVGDFQYGLDGFYRENRGKIRKVFAAAYTEYANTIYPIAADEVNYKEDPGAEYQQYVDEFVDHTTDRYIGSSRGQLVEQAAKYREDDPAGAIDARLAEWEETRPDKIADREAVDGECGFAQFVYFAAGFRTIWVALGDNCPYCNALDGKTISRGMSFLNAGQSFEPDGAVNGPLIVKQNISHPAAHGGCDCTVRAGL